MTHMGILAYIDPGSGSLILQATLAGLLSIPFFFRRTIGGAWRRLRGEKVEAPVTNEADGPESTDP
jgi:hypothetical protein